MSPPHTALLAGASGLVGGACLELLEADSAYSQVTALVRHPAGGGAHAPRVAFETVDFDHLDPHPAVFALDHVFCALGTTIRTAGSRRAFRHVDFDFPLRIARPSMLLGHRVESRLFEKIGIPLSFLLPPRYWPVRARQVATALVAAAREDRPGRRLIENRKLHAFAAGG